MIGVHLRRGDFHRANRWSVDNTRPALAEVRKFLQTRPEAGIFLSTDDGGVDPVTKEQRLEGTHAIFQNAFGERVVWTQPRSLDRGDPAAVQDALLDLLLLRTCDFNVGTWNSSFSELAVFGRDAPSVQCRSTGGALGWVDGLGKRLGLWTALNRMARGLTGGRANGIQLLLHVRNWPRATVARLLRTYAPGFFERVRPKRNR
jgi:hypothetical protein